MHVQTWTKILTNMFSDKVTKAGNDADVKSENMR